MNQFFGMVFCCVHLDVSDHFIVGIAEHIGHCGSLDDLSGFGGFDDLGVLGIGDEGRIGFFGFAGHSLKPTGLSLADGIDDQQQHAHRAGRDTHPGNDFIAGDNSCDQSGQADDRQHQRNDQHRAASRGVMWWSVDPVSAYPSSESLR